MGRRCIALLVALGALAPAAPGLADVVGPPPRCPPGSRGFATHAGGRCLATPCYADQGCTDQTCQRWRVCQRPTSVAPAGRYASQNPSEASHEMQVVETCPPAQRCSGTEPIAAPTTGAPEGPVECRVASYCVRTPPPSPPPHLDLGAGPDSAGWPAPAGLLPAPGARSARAPAVIERGAGLPREHGRALEQPDVSGDDLPVFHREPPAAAPSSCACGAAPTEAAGAALACSLLTVGILVWRRR